jgi:hypothetical protein
LHGCDDNGCDVLPLSLYCPYLIKLKSIIYLIRLCENWNLSWGKTTFTVLGINFDVDISKITKINYEKYLN